MHAPLAIYTAPISSSCSALEFVRKAGGNDTLHGIRKERDRQEVVQKLQAMLMVEDKVARGAKVGMAIREVSLFFRGRRGMSPSRIQDYYQLWRNGGQKPDVHGKRAGVWYSPRDWQMFIPSYTNGQPDAVLANQKFTTFIQQLFSDTCRDDATGNALHARLQDMWFSGQSIPGFGTIHEWCAQHGRPVPTGSIRRAADMPDGWSRRNLLRMIPEQGVKRVYIQRGEHAAHSHWGDQLLRDRSKLMPFQLITFDDVRFDIKVAMPIPGKGAQVVYPSAIFALDVATGTILAKGVMGQYTRDEDSDGGKEGTRRGFQQADMRWLVTSMLERFGTPRDWSMTLLLENASASLSETDKRSFEQVGIRILNTGLIRNKLTASGFIEQGGMPWQKGWIEAFFRIMHTRINHLPGTTGRRYDLTRGDVEDRVRYTINTIEKARKLGIPFAELNLPLLSLEEFHTLLDEYVLRLNFRTNHTLQGFDKVYEYETSPGEFIRSDDPRAASIVPVGSELYPRMEAPIERAHRLLQGHQMQPVHPRQLMALALDKRVITVRNDQVRIQSSSISTDALIFRDKDTAETLAKYNGQEKALIGFIATDRTQVHLFTNDEDMAYVCSPRNVERVDITDETAILCRSGEVHRGRQRIRDEVAELLEPANAELSHMRRYNEALLSGSIAVDRIATAIDDAETLQRASRTRDKSIRQHIDETPDIDAAHYLSHGRTFDEEPDSDDLDRYIRS